MPNGMRSANALAFIFVCTVAGSFATSAHGQAQTPAFVAPPRTIADITAILDQEKPDPKVAVRMRAEADANPPAGAGQGDLAKFYYNRCVARNALGDSLVAVADCEKVVQLGRTALATNDYGRLRQGLSNQYGAIGEPRKALDVLLESVRTVNVKGSQG
jgi:hypothetical protein